MGYEYQDKKCFHNSDTIRVDASKERTQDTLPVFYKLGVGFLFSFSAFKKISGLMH